MCVSMFTGSEIGGHCGRAYHFENGFDSDLETP